MCAIKLYHQKCKIIVKKNVYLDSNNRKATKNPVCGTFYKTGLIHSKMMSKKKKKMTEKER